LFEPLSQKGGKKAENNKGKGERKSSFALPGLNPFLKKKKKKRGGRNVRRGVSALRGWDAAYPLYIKRKRKGRPVSGLPKRGPQNLMEKKGKGQSAP